MSQLAEMYESYFTTIERQTMRFEDVASKLKGEDKRAILEIVTDVRKEVQTLRERVDLCAEWG
jgi:hypothetical protein